MPEKTKHSLYVPFLIVTAGLLMMAGAVLTLVPLKDCAPCSWGTPVDSPEHVDLWAMGCACSGTESVLIWDLWNREHPYIWDGSFE